MGLDPQRNFTVDLILGASMRTSACIPLSPAQSTLSSPLEMWGSGCPRGNEPDSQWLSNHWRGKSTREVLMWSGTGHVAPLLWGQADVGSRLLRGVRCLSTAPGEVSLFWKEMSLTDILMDISNELDEMTPSSRSWLLIVTNLCLLYRARRVQGTSVMAVTSRMMEARSYIT